MMKEQTTGRLTWAEYKVMDFLSTNKGVEYTPKEIQDQTNVRADLIDMIVENLQWKGYSVASRGNKYWFIKNTVWSYIVGGGLIGIFLLFMLFSFLGYFG